MACTEVRSKKRVRRFIDLCMGTIYIFGGKTENNICSNKLYKLKVKDDHEVAVEEILYHGNPENQNIPEPRHSCCFEYIGNGYLLLYGGREVD